MSRRILQALMQLFALIAVPEKNQQERISFVKDFLGEQLNKEQVSEFIEIYRKYLQQYQIRRSKSNPNKFLSVSSVRLLTICSLLNEELTRQQKFIVLINLLEFIRKGSGVEQAFEFIDTVVDTFKLPFDEYYAIRDFIFKPSYEFNDPERILAITSSEEKTDKINILHLKGMIGKIFFLNIKSIELLLFFIEGGKDVFLNQQILKPHKIYILSIGSALRTSSLTPIYYTDILSVFTESKIKSNIVFEANRIAYKFKNGNIGLHEFNFIEKSGRLVGIMGASGSGKTTLVNILNGNYLPTAGNIFINGIDFHKNKDKLLGYIGYVSQEDLLIEELTVFENLFYNAKLCFGDLSEFSIKRKVIQIIKELGLFDIMGMRVGTPLNRNISGGQRKRLNIALELIREPPILFLDEPTSGLSSRDSENIMDLLKTLTHKGKLVFVVIHQPSSTIFKMFDRLVVIDKGGYVIYNGKPIESIIYFKSAISDADWSDTVCPTCGNVNPEQVFNIIETRVLDEYGNQTSIRKIAPEDWAARYRELEEPKNIRKRYLVRNLPEIQFSIPSKLKQFFVFTKRDFITKLSNLQYILINLLETPLMALILSYIIKYWPWDYSDGYSLLNNDNLPVYIFMSVIIAIFVGLILSAQEIFKDRKIKERERFLNLSRGSYLFSKIVNLSVISAYQSLVFVIVGNGLMEISFFNFEYWLVLYSVWVSSNILGLIISETFKTSVAIYIIIPFLVIPQLILSGVLVPYDKLNPTISRPYSIPWYGEIIIARWAYEALAVKQFKDNPYYKSIFPYDQKLKQSIYIKDFWCKKMEQKAKEVRKYLEQDINEDKIIDNLKLLQNEFKSNHIWLNKKEYPFDINKLNNDNIDISTLDSAIIYLQGLIDKYKRNYNIVNYKKNQYLNILNTDSSNLYTLKRKYTNTKLEDFVDNKNSTNIIVEYNNHLYRGMSPIYMIPENKFFKAQFYSAYKPVGKLLINTYIFNIIVIWFFSLIQFLMLYYRFFPKLFEFYDVVNKRIKKRFEFTKTEKTQNKRIKYFKKLRRFIQRYKM